MRGWRLGIFIGLAVIIWYWHWVSGLDPELQPGQKVNVIGTIAQQPVVKTDQFTGEEYLWVWIAVGSETFGFRADRWEEIGYGSRVEIEGVISTLGSVSDQEEKSQFQRFGLSPGRWVVAQTLDPRYRADGHRSYKTYKSYTIAGHSPRNRSTLTRIRNDVLILFRQTLPRDEAALLSGMVLGTKGELSDSFHKALQVSGTIHVVVASGFNVMLVAGAVAGLAVTWVRRQTAVILGILGIWGYVALVGCDAPVVRAGLMGTLAFFSIVTGRVRDTGWLLVISAVIMLWWRPQWLWDVGFQLSVAATAGLIWLEPVLSFRPSEAAGREEEKSQKLQKPDDSESPTTPNPRSSADGYRTYITSAAGGLSSLALSAARILHLPLLGDSLRTTLAAQLAVLPILLHTFGEVSVWSPLTNALVLWVTPIVTGVGMLVGVLHVFFSFSVLQFLSPSALWLTYPLLRYFVLVVQWFGQFDTLHWQMTWWGIAGYYAGLWLVVRRLSSRTSEAQPRK